MLGTAANSITACFRAFQGRAQLDRISIQWPDGDTQEHRDVAAGKCYLIRQSDASIQVRAQP